MTVLFATCSVILTNIDKKNISYKKVLFACDNMGNLNALSVPRRF